MRHNRLFRNHARVLTHAKHCIDPCKHAGSELQLAVVNTATYANRTAVGINQRVNGLNFCAVFAAWQCVHIEHRRLARFDLGLKPLRQSEVDKNRVNVFKVHDVCTVFEVVADVDLPDADNAVEWRKNLQACRSGLGQ